MATFDLRILTPAGEAFDDEVTSVTAPGAEGYFGVLAGHAPMLVALQAGPLDVHTGSGETVSFRIEEGLLEVSDAGCFVLCDAAARAEADTPRTLSW